MSLRSTLRVAVEAAGTQQEVTLPPLVLRLRAKSLNNLPVVVSMVEGEVEQFGGVVVSPGAEWDSGLMQFDGGAIYVASPTPDAELQIEFWIATDPLPPPEEPSGFDFGFDSGFES